MSIADHAELRDHAERKLRDGCEIAALVLALLADYDDLARRHGRSEGGTHSAECWSWRGHHECAISKVRELEKLNAALAERCAAQSELLSKRSEKT